MFIYIYLNKNLNIQNKRIYAFIIKFLHIYACFINYFYTLAHY